MTTAGSASGMEPTASATPIPKSTAKDSPGARPITTIATNAKRAATMMKMVSRSTCLVSGVFSTFCPDSMWAMWPTSEPMPVVVTRISPWPRVTFVFMNAMFRRSPMPTSCRPMVVGVLLDRDALAGQGALLDLEGRRQDDPAVGGDAVTGIDHHDVAGHDLLGGELHHVTVAAHLGHRLHHLPQGGSGRFGLALLVVAQPRVEQRQQGKPDSGPVFRDQQADQGGDHEHDLHVVPVVLEEPFPHRLLLCGGQGVRAVLLQPLLRLGRAQPAGRIHPQLGRHLRRCQRVPGSRPPRPGPPLLLLRDCRS